MLQNEKVIEELGGNPNYRVVVYEELCESPERKCRELFEFVGLPWSEQTKEFIELGNRQESGGERYYQIVRNPVHSAYKWCDELSKQQIEEIRQAVSDSLPGKLYWNGKG